MRALVVSGIWPPDVGGPASHAPDVATFLLERGHRVAVVTTATASPEPRPFPVHWVSRSLPKGLIHLRATAEVARRAAAADVVYTTGMFGRSSAGASLAVRPYVVKLTADPAFERARRRGTVGGDVDRFQSVRGGAQVRLLRRARDWELRRAAHVFTPSAYLRELAVSWGVPAERVSVLPNPAPRLPDLPPRDELRRSFGLNGATLAFAGRLTAQKSLDVALEAVARTEGVRLLIAGDGDERGALEARAAELGLGGRVEFLGAQPRERVVALFGAADAAILSSSWENFPHSVVEALAAGTPVLATAIGGVAEVVRDGENGLLVPPGDAEALAGRDRPLLRRRGAARTAPGRCGRLRPPLRPRRDLRHARADPPRGGGAAVTAKPRALFVSRTRYALPLSASLGRKWEALGEELELRVLASAAAADAPRRDGVFTLVPPGPVPALAGVLFWLLLPWRVARVVRSFRPDVIVAQSPYEAAAALLARRLAGSDARIATDVQGDWRTATRLYGSPLRALLRRPADALAAAALRRVDAVRTISPYTSGLVRALGIEPAGTFPTFIDLGPFADREPVSPPAEPVALFVGVLEPYKNVDGLAEAWRIVAERVPGARLHVVGKGSREEVVRALLDECPSVRWTRELDTEGVAAAMDEATLLVLPSRSEGMGRVVIEAFCRARPVVGTRVGGIADLVEDGRNGVLVEPGSTGALADALVQLLGDGPRAAALGAEARRLVQPWLQTAEEYSRRIRAVVEAASSRAP